MTLLGTSSSFKVSAMGTVGRGLSPEEITDRVMGKLIHIADSAPDPIKDQAVAFETKVRALLLSALRECALNERTTIYNELTNAGLEDAAAILWGRN